MAEAGPSDLTRAQAAYEKLARYAATANGTALVLSATAIAKIVNPASAVQIGRWPLVLFALGLFLSGVYLCAVILHAIENIRRESRAKINDLRADVEKARVSQLDSGIIDPRISKLARGVEALDSAMEPMDKLGVDIGDAYARMQEWSLILSYTCFFSGLGVAIARL
jgi:hypothetical protein